MPTGGENRGAACDADIGTEDTGAERCGGGSADHRPREMKNQLATSQGRAQEAETGASELRHQLAQAQVVIDQLKHTEEHTLVRRLSDSGQ